VSNRDGSFQPRQSPLQHVKDDKERWLFYFDGNNTSPASSAPSNPQIYQSHMIYYDSGRFYIAADNLDELQLRAKLAAGDGGEPSDIAWRPLTFSPLPYGRMITDISYALIRGSESELIKQTCAEAQGWPFKLLPQQHHSRTLVHPTHPSGLTGDLSLLISLLAMTIPSEAVPILLPALIAHDQWGPNWHTHAHLPTQIGCMSNIYTSIFSSYILLTLTRATGARLVRHDNLRWQTGHTGPVAGLRRRPLWSSVLSILRYPLHRRLRKIRRIALSHTCMRVVFSFSENTYASRQIGHCNDEFNSDISSLDTICVETSTFRHS
jgi:hypothetical protein